MKSGQPAFQPLPYPPGKILARCVVQSLDLVQIVVVQLLAQGFERLGDLGVVDKPASLGINLPAHSNFALERMPVQPRAFMFGRNIGQSVRRLKRELFYKIDNHSQPILASSLIDRQTAAESMEP